ncbi:MAG: orotidine-5'-phosphate decarboxylase [Deltaproteobacteria bacterium]|nr:orotidine-5'-phosphate decarboxylase [Deltaproteobacteria bacterium]
MAEVIVALDVSSVEEAEKLVTQLSPVIHFYKVGLQLFIAHHARAVEAVRRHGGDVFLDLKLHDIPQTVANAVKETARLGVHSVSFHLSGGRAMIEAAAAVPGRPKLWGVSVLTSMTDEDLRVLGGRTTSTLVPDLARMGAAAGMDGLVCSGHELPLLDGITPRPVRVVPGIRGPDDAVGDQKRVMTPAEAAARGADFLVVGRPITHAKDPRAAAERIVADAAR